MGSSAVMADETEWERERLRAENEADEIRAVIRDNVDRLKSKE